MEPLVAAVRAGCTVGEVCDVYRETFGEYRDPAWL
jgi:methylmalonyl-CoA mutase N-terminal domain/subunit